MARVTLTTNALVPNGSIADPTGTASVAGAGNGFTVPYFGGKNLFLRVANASGSAGTISVLAGTQPLAIAGGQGAATSASIPTGTTAWFGPFESARVEQSDGSLSIETSQIMTVTAFTLDGRYVG